jgi:hypothetical protein
MVGDEQTWETERREGDSDVTLWRHSGACLPSRSSLEAREVVGKIFAGHCKLAVWTRGGGEHSSEVRHLGLKLKKNSSTWPSSKTLNKARCEFVLLTSFARASMSGVRLEFSTFALRRSFDWRRHQDDRCLLQVALQCNEANSRELVRPIDNGRGHSLPSGTACERFVGPILGP